MRRPLRMIAAAALVAGAPAIPSAASAVAQSPVPITITASPGSTDAVARALGASSLRVVRRDGRDLQVTASPDRLGGLRAIPGVAAVRAAGGGMAETDPDDPGAAVAASGAVRSEGFERVGADALQALAGDGAGVTIAVLDLGFGSARIPSLQAKRELPPSARLETRSFDATWGLAGRNAYGNATNHGELVAQTVFDYAPAAQYVFVNYHTEQDFQAAVEWLIQRRPDVVVHSNSFIEGPFDGSGAAAQAVDRAAAAGIAWDSAKLLAIHKEAWRIAAAQPDDLLAPILAEPDAARRVWRAINTAGLTQADVSTVVTDSLARLGPGGAHALACWLVDSGYVARLNVVAIDTVGEWFNATLTNELSGTVHRADPRSATWTRLTKDLEALGPDDRRLAGALVSTFKADRKIDTSALQAAIRSFGETNQALAKLAASAHGTQGG